MGKETLSKPAPKKRKDDKAKIALDNAVAAMLSLAVNHPAACPPETYKLIISKLPLKDDEEEAKKTHKQIADQILAQNAGLLGESSANLPDLLKFLAEIHK